MALARCANADVLRGRIHFPYRGAWFAPLVLDTATLPSGQVQIVVNGGFTLTGTIEQPSGVQLDAAHVRVVGGGGGLGTIVSPAAYENALLRDPLNAVLQQSGEKLSGTVDASITSLLLSKWTHVAQRAADAIDRLAYAAGHALGKVVVWRVLGDGTVWIGADTWTSQAMPSGSDVIDYFPEEGRYELGVEAPWLMPGVNVTGIGNVAAVDHVLEHDGNRSHAWPA